MTKVFVINQKESVYLYTIYVFSFVYLINRKYKLHCFVVFFFQGDFDG